MTKQNKPELETINFPAQILSTADFKENGEFTRDVKAKTAYIITDEQTSEKLKSFGLQQYTPKEANENGELIPFFVIPFAGECVFLEQSDKTYSTMDMTDKSLPNFKFEGSALQIEVIKGKNKGQTFKRITGVMTDSNKTIKEFYERQAFGFKLSQFANVDTQKLISDNSAVAIEE